MLRVLLVMILTLDMRYHCMSRANFHKARSKTVNCTSLAIIVTSGTCNVSKARSKTWIAHLAPVQWQAPSPRIIKTLFNRRSRANSVRQSIVMRLKSHSQSHESPFSHTTCDCHPCTWRSILFVSFSLFRLLVSILNSPDWWGCRRRSPLCNNGREAENWRATRSSPLSCCQWPWKPNRRTFSVPDNLHRQVRSFNIPVCVIFCQHKSRFILFCNNVENSNSDSDLKFSDSITCKIRIRVLSL